MSEYQIVYNHSNSNKGYKSDDKFNSIILPILNKLAKEKNIFWISGDIGVSWSLPLFYDKNNKTGICYIANGIGDTEKDVLIKINIQDGEVKFSLFSLGIENKYKLEHYNLQYWNMYFKDNQVSSENKYIYTILSKIQRMLMHKYYWVGFISFLPIILLFLFIKKRLSS